MGVHGSDTDEAGRVRKSTNERRIERTKRGTKIGVKYVAKESRKSETLLAPALVAVTRSPRFHANHLPVFSAWNVLRGSSKTRTIAFFCRLFPPMRMSMRFGAVRIACPTSLKESY